MHIFYLPQQGREQPRIGQLNGEPALQVTGDMA